MDMKRIPLRDVRVGDWLMVPPGQGKHRGVQNDSGILVVSDVYVGLTEVYIMGSDMIDGWEYSIKPIKSIVNGQYSKVEVVR